jgi:hypothetical protein
VKGTPVLYRKLHVVRKEERNSVNFEAYMHLGLALGESEEKIGETEECHWEALPSWTTLTW